MMAFRCGYCLCACVIPISKRQAALRGGPQGQNMCVLWHPISTAPSCNAQTAAATQQAEMSACRLCGGLECACQRSVAPAGPGPPEQGMS